MRRHIVIITLLLIGGAIVSVAVAWGCAAYFQWQWGGWTLPSFNGWEMHSKAELAEMADEVLEKGDGEAIDWIMDTGTGGTGLAPGMRMRSLAYGSGVGVSILVYDAGWPLYSVQSWETKATIRGMNSRSYAIVVGSRGRTIWLPYRVRWPGFIINTLFYALLLWLLFFASFTTRRMLRRRRGLCEKCAYPIGESPVCTECGAAVTHPRKAEA